MINLATPEIWFVCGSQHLYGPGPLRQVADHAESIAAELSASPALPLKIVCKPTATTPEEIARLCAEASADDKCAGLILWMHTFSPAKMWIRGLNLLKKPFLHLHTQFNQTLPWGEIDMDFMNLNQSAHGDREAGFTAHPHAARPQGGGRPLVGPRGSRTHRRLDAGCARLARLAGRAVRRFGDNMRYVAVTEGDKVVGGDAVRLLDQRLRRRRPRVAQCTPSRTPQSRRSSGNTTSSTSRARTRRRRRAPRESLRYAARQELGMRALPRRGRRSRASPRPSKTCTGFASCRALRRNA